MDDLWRVEGQAAVRVDRHKSCPHVCLREWRRSMSVASRLGFRGHWCRLKSFFHIYNWMTIFLFIFMLLGRSCADIVCLHGTGHHGVSAPLVASGDDSVSGETKGQATQTLEYSNSWSVSRITKMVLKAENFNTYGRGLISCALLCFVNLIAHRWRHKCSAQPPRSQFEGTGDRAWFLLSLEFR